MTDRVFKICCVIGTRPEIIKMAPIIHELEKHSHFRVDIINTAQHRDLLDNMLEIFDIEPTFDLNIMKDNQTLNSLTGRLLLELEPIISRNKYDMVIAQGDTTTTLVAAQTAFYYKIPFAHVEAGLRSYNIYHPYPEEANRVMVTPLTSLHFSPTDCERDNLMKEGVDPSRIFVTGNTVIDSLLHFAKKDTPLPFSVDGKRLLLVTMHRRESFGDPLREIFASFKTLTQQFPDIEIVYPTHPNPNVRQACEEILNGVDRIHLIEPLQYDVFVSLMKHAYLILTDSGGIQEEAPALDKPVIILRELTERPLVVSEGMGVLVGSNKDKIVSVTSELLTNPSKYHSMQKGRSPYGDGQASRRIVEAIDAFLQKTTDKKDQ